MKWDGVRAITRCGSDGVSLWSRNLREIIGSYPEVVAALAEVTEGRSILLDGELVAPDDRGAPSFSRLQRCPNGSAAGTLRPIVHTHAAVDSDHRLAAAQACGRPQGAAAGIGLCCPVPEFDESLSGLFGPDQRRML